MNIAQIKEMWDLEKLLSHLGFEPDRKKSKGHSLFYKSPFRPCETSPSFRIDTRYDIWKDYGLGEKGGDLILFAQKYLTQQGRASNVKETLTWFRDITGSVPAPRRIDHTIAATDDHAIDEPEILEDRTLIIGSLLQNLKSRKISVEIANNYLRQIKFRRPPNPKEIFGYGFANRSGGIEFSNPLKFKTALGTKDISLIAGQDRTRIEVFEGVFDFLTRLTLEGNPIPPHDACIMNTIEMHNQTTEMIKSGNYTRCIFWLDNDVAGEKAMCQIEENLHESNQGLHLQKMNAIYSTYKDLNEWHVETSLNLEAKRSLIYQNLILPNDPTSHTDFAIPSR